MENLEYNERIEIFKKNMEEAGFTSDFIVQALHYFNQLKEEGEVQEINSLIEVIDYYSKTGSFTYNSLQSFYNLYNFREDLYKLYFYDTHNSLDFFVYFENIEEFEIRILYTLYLEFYPREEEEEEEEEEIN